MKIHIKGGRLIDPKHGVDAQRDVYIAAGKVVGIGEAPVAGFTWRSLKPWWASGVPCEMASSEALVRSNG